MAARKKKGRLQASARKGRATARRAPAALPDAVAGGIKRLNKSRSQAEQMIRDAFESAQGSVQSRLDTARDQATETWDNLEALFQSRVQKALQQIGVPSAEEVRLLTRRVAELNESVLALSGKSARSGARRALARTSRKTARRVTRRKSARVTR